MSGTDIRSPEKVATGHPASRPGQLHLPLKGPEAPHAHRLPAVEPERTKSELKIEFLEETPAPAEVAREEKTKEIIPRLKALYAERPELFSLAFQELKKTESGLNSREFSRRLVDGLTFLSQLNPQSDALTAAQLIGSLQPAANRELTPGAEALAQLYRLGLLAADCRLAYPKTERLLAACLVVRQERDEALGAFIDDMAADKAVYFLPAVELLSRLHDKQLEQLEAAAQKESFDREAALKRWAERKKDEEQYLLRQTAERLDNDVWLALGQALLTARAEIEVELEPCPDFLPSVAAGLTALLTPETILEKTLVLTEAEAVACFAVAYRWNRLLPWLAEESHQLLRFNLVNYLSSPLRRLYQKKNDALKVLDNRRIIPLVTSGSRLLLIKQRKDTLCEADFSPETLIAVGRFGRAVGAAAASRESDCLVPLLRYYLDNTALDNHLPRELEAPLKRQVIEEALKAAGPGIVPALLSAYNLLAPELIPQNEATVLDAVAYLIGALPCRREIITSLLETVQRSAERPPERPKHGKPEIIPLLPRTQKSNTAEPAKLLLGILHMLFMNIQPALPVETLEIEASNDASWGLRFQIELERLSEDNRLPGRPTDERLLAHRVRLMSLACALVTARELAAQGRPLEARAALHRLLAEAARTGYTLSYAQALIGSVYAGLLEKYPGDKRQELPALLTDHDTPELSLGLNSVAQVLAGEIHTALGRRKEMIETAPVEEILLHGIVMNRVGLFPSKAARVITALKNEPVVWEHLLDLLRQQQPEAAATYVEQLLSYATDIVVKSEVTPARLRLIIRPFDPHVLSQAAGKLKALPDLLAATA